jgi:hypothetical protein
MEKYLGDKDDVFYFMTNMRMPFVLEDMYMDDVINYLNILMIW